MRTSVLTASSREEWSEWAAQGPGDDGAYYSVLEWYTFFSSRVYTPREWTRWWLFVRRW